MNKQWQNDDELSVCIYNPIWFLGVVRSVSSWKCCCIDVAHDRTNANYTEKRFGVYVWKFNVEEAYCHQILKHWLKIEWKSVKRFFFSVMQQQQQRWWGWWWGTGDVRVKYTHIIPLISGNNKAKRVKERMIVVFVVDFAIGTSFGRTS